MRTPPRFSVESDRPLMVTDPSGWMVTQSPCRHTPSYAEK